MKTFALQMRVNLATTKQEYVMDIAVPRACSGCLLIQPTEKFGSLFQDAAICKSTEFSVTAPNLPSVILVCNANCE